MQKFIISILTFWIPIPNIRRQFRKILKEFFLLHNKRFQKTLQNITQLLKNEKKIFAMVSIPWGYCMYQRPQYIASHISKFGYKFLYCDVSLQNFLDYKVENNVIIINPNILLHLSTNVAKNINVIIPCNEGWCNIDLLNTLKNKGYKIIYDLIDDFDESISGNNTEQLKVFNNLEEINPRLCLATAKNLYNMLAKRFGEEKVLLNPNAVEIENFTNIDTKTIPEDLKSILEQGKPIIGYYGAMAPWLDWDLLNKVHKMRPDYSFVYIGMNYGGALKNLKPNRNVFYLGEKYYKELPLYSHYFDCCTIPFAKGDIAKSTNPLKLFEYMASKKTVVCTEDLLECYGYKGVLIASDVDDFAKKLDKAIKLSKDMDIQAILFNYAQQNTWQQRVSDILSKIN